MTNPNDPAFINPIKLDSKLDFCGLTKRELFAAMAMQGILAGFKVGMEHASEEILKKEILNIPGASLRMADALCAELNKEVTK